ncbi:MAG TPA: 30S ribosomal protein S12 methylthiotransferase RimO [Acidimicrobiales bacterium]|nr:30S ribosomal protein S12 methylthiotransferase RimO [Acidimicrobiales bacterium]
MAQRRFWVETLGCPKNSVDSDKVTGRLLADGYLPADAPTHADLVVVNTCAFIEEARQESIDTILSLSDARRDGAEVVVTGCMAERYGDELAEALPEVDRVVGFGGPITGAPAAGADWVPVSIGRATSGAPGGSEPAVPALDLLNMPRPAATAPWAYLKVAEGCDRACGFCAIPSFRGPQRSRDVASVIAEAESLAASGVREVVLVAQDLASYGRDQGRGSRALVPLLDELASLVDRVRLLYLYPSELNDALIDAICRTGVPYFDLSLQHVSRPLVRRMRRWGDGEKYLERIRTIRAREPEAAFRSNFIVGYPGETEADHDALLAFVHEAQLDWCGFFRYSEEDGTYAADLDGAVPDAVVADRLFELRDLQDDITAARRDALVGHTVSVLVDEPGVGRSHREAPEIDGIITVPEHLEVGSIVDVEVVAAEGPEVHARLPQPDPVGQRA